LRTRRRSRHRTDGFAAARLAGAGVLAAAAHAVAVGAIGGLLIALKALLH
jgi:hypothetical protein